MGKILKFVLLVVVLIAAAYVAGFWPQRDRIGVLQAENAALLQRADAAEARVRAAAILGELLALKEVVQDMNYGQARGLSSPFYERVRAEAGRNTDAAVKPALEFIMTLRDPVTVALTQGDAAALAHLRESERRLRQALGYPAPPPAPAASPIPAGMPPLPVPFPAPVTDMTPSPAPLPSP
jgi:hypothetical protein